MLVTRMSWVACVQYIGSRSCSNTFRTSMICGTTTVPGYICMSSSKSATAVLLAYSYVLACQTYGYCLLSYVRVTVILPTVCMTSVCATLNAPHKHASNTLCSNLTSTDRVNPKRHSFWHHHVSDVVVQLLLASCHSTRGSPGSLRCRNIPVH